MQIRSDPGHSQDGSFHGLHHIGQSSSVVDLAGAKVGQLDDTIAGHKDVASLDIPT